MGLQDQPSSAVPLQVPVHLLQPSQSYMQAVPNTVHVQPSYVLASQPMQSQTYSSLPSTAQQQLTVLHLVQPTPAQSTSTVPQKTDIQSCPLARQSVQANATAPPNYPPGVQKLTSTHVLPPLQQAEPGQALPSLQQATQNIPPDQQFAVQNLPNVQNLPASQPASAYIAVQHASTVQNFQEAAALQLSMQASETGASSQQHCLSGASLKSQEDPLMTAQATSQKGLHVASMIAAGKENVKESSFQTSHTFDVPAQPVR